MKIEVKKFSHSVTFWIVNTSAELAIYNPLWWLKEYGFMNALYFNFCNNEQEFALEWFVVSFVFCKKSTLI